MHQKQCTAHSGEKRPAASIWKNWVPCVFFCFGTCAIIKHKGKLIPQAKQLPVKIDRFTSVQMCHTHTLSLAGWCRGRWGEDEDERGVKVRWPWRWDEELLNQNAKRGTQKKERTPTRHTWPGAGKPWKGQGKEKRRVDGHGTRPAEGGEGRKRLNQPDTAKTYKHLSTRRNRPTWGGKNAWDREPMGTSWWNHQKKNKTQFLNA